MKGATIAKTPNIGMGGLSTNYTLAVRQVAENNVIGFAPINSKKNIIFLATNTVGKGGKVVEFYEAVKSSGVPVIPGATKDSDGKAVISLLMLDSGKTSCALAHKNPNNNFIKVYEGDKHNGFPYYTNTFVRLKATKPRN